MLHPSVELLFVRAAAPLSEDALERATDSDNDSDSDWVIVRHTVPIEDMAE